MSQSDLCQSQREELDSLQAIYCKPEEFTFLKTPEGQHVIIQFDLFAPNTEKPSKGKVSLLLPPDYPMSCPEEIVIFCNLFSSSGLDSIRLKVEERSKTLKGECMLLDLMCYLQELLETSLTCDISYCNDNSTHGSAISENQDSVVTDSGICDMKILSHGNYVNQPNPSKDRKVQDVEESSTALLQLDHMRSKHNYKKLIEKWTSDLGLYGKLFFYGKFIFIILQGHSDHIKEYIVRNKTMIVDVDAKGRPCKERMLKVLCEVPSENYVRFHKFETVENLLSFEDFTTQFQSFSMMDIFKGYIEPQCSVKSKKSLRK